MITTNKTNMKCDGCGNSENVTSFRFERQATIINALATTIFLCLGCRKKMAELLKED